MESRLALYLLGPPRIECDGVPVTLNRRKAVALLAYLAVTGERQRRDSLVNLLWPEYDGTRGRAALRRTLYTLRKALAGGWLYVDRQEIGLTPSSDSPAGSGPSLWVDVAQFRQHLAECETHGHSTSQVCPACVTPLGEAVALARGDFLSGFGLKDSFVFDDWQLFQAEALRRELAAALERLMDWHSGQREFEAAAGYARRRLALDPLEERANRQLMRLYAWSGRRSAALRQYEDWVAVLEEQLGVPPQVATTELYQAIQTGQAPPPPEEIRAGEALEHPAELPSFLEGEVPIEQPVFVARERELAQLDEFLDLALSGQGRVAFVTGEVGSGKTALAQEFARRAQDLHADLIVASGNCNAYTGIGDPYLPFREILGLLTGDVEAQWAAGAMTREHAHRLWDALPLAAQSLEECGPDLIDTFVSRAALIRRARIYAPNGADWLTNLDEAVERRPVSPGTPRPPQDDLFEQYTRVLQALARQVSIVLVVDDLQWADLGSISLLFHLGRQLAGSRILIVGAYRPEEIALGRDGQRHPLDPVVNELRRVFGDVSVELGRVGGRDFIEALLDSPASTLAPNRLGVTFREMLYRQTRGHPLFTVELLRGLQEQGDMVQDAEGRWVEGAALDWKTLPARVEAVIAERIGRLAEPLRAELRVASVEGETFTAEVVARVQAAGEGEVVGHLSRDLDRRHRLVRAQGILWMDGQRLSRYRFRHSLFQRYLYNSLDAVERAHLHAAVGNTLETLHEAQAEAMAATVATGAVAGQLAWHFQEAGMAAKAIDYLRQAGDRAVRLCAYQEAIAHLSRGLELLLTLPGSPECDQQELALQLSLGTARTRAGAFRREQVGAALARARELCEQIGKEPQLCHVLGDLVIFHYVRAEHRRARELAEEALSLAQQVGDPLLVAEGHWWLGLGSYGLGRYTAARDHFQQVITFYDPQEHHQPIVFLRGLDAGVSAMSYDACCLWALGYPDQASRRSGEVLALAREFGHSFSLADALAFAGCEYNKMRRDASAFKEHAEELVRLSKEKALPGWLPTGISYRGEAAAMLGQLQEGIAQMREGLTGGQTRGIRMYESGVLCTLAGALAKAGLLEQGLTTLDEALALVEKTDQRHWEADLHRVRGELLLMQGDSPAAEASLQKAISVARSQSAKSWELRATSSLARLWREQGRVGDSRRMLAEIYGWFSEGFDTPDLREAKELLDELGYREGLARDS